MKLFNCQPGSVVMAGVFDYIPLLTIVLVTLGLVGVIIYEKTRTPE